MALRNFSYVFLAVFLSVEVVLSIFCFRVYFVSLVAVDTLIIVTLLKLGANILIIIVDLLGLSIDIVSDYIFLILCSRWC